MTIADETMKAWTEKSREFKQRLNEVLSTKFVGADLSSEILQQIKADISELAHSMFREEHAKPILDCITTTVAPGGSLLVGFGGLSTAGTITDEKERWGLVRATIEKIKARSIPEEDVQRRYSIAMAEVGMLIDSVFPSEEALQEGVVIQQAIGLCIALPNKRYGTHLQQFTSPTWAEEQEDRLMVVLRDLDNLYAMVADGEAQ